MQRRNDRPLNVRALLESLGVPFTIAQYRPREALFLQGDASESVMYIEKGRVWLAVTTPWTGGDLRSSGGRRVPG